MKEHLISGLFGAIGALLISIIYNTIRKVIKLNKTRFITVDYIKKIGIPMSQEMIDEYDNLLNHLTKKEFYMEDIYFDERPMLNNNFLKRFSFNDLYSAFNKKDAIEFYVFSHTLSFQVSNSPSTIYYDLIDILEKDQANSNSIILEERVKYSKKVISSMKERVKENIHFMKQVLDEYDKNNCFFWLAKYLFK